MKKAEIDYLFIPSEKLESFLIGKMEAERLVVPTPAFHRHSFYEILWLKTGTGSHIVDGNCLELAPNTFSLIRKGQIHKFNEVKNAYGFFLRFTDDFLPDLKGQEARIYAHLFTYPASPGQNPVHIPPAYQPEIEQLVRLIFDEYHRENSLGKRELVRHLLLAFLIKVERLFLLQEQTSHGSPNNEVGDYQLFDNYIALLEKHYRSEHKVEFYAENLQISPRQLTRLLQHKTGKSAKRLIVERLLVEAKRLLSFTELSVKEIAGSLGYSDPYHFSKLFKQETGLPPKAFRER